MSNNREDGYIIRSEEGVLNLRDAIIESAADDYIRAALWMYYFKTGQLKYPGKRKKCDKCVDVDGKKLCCGVTSEGCKARGRYEDYKHMRKQVLRFFKSEWYDILFDFDGESLRNKLDRYIVQRIEEEKDEEMETEIEEFEAEDLFEFDAG